MEKRKLVLTHSLEDKLLKQVEAVIPDWEIVSGKDSEDWKHHLGSAEIVGGWNNELTSILEQTDNPSLRWIQAWSAGVNSYPLALLQEKKILISSANGVHSYPISETIVALMLGLTRHVHTYVRNQQSKTWHHGGLKLEMHGKTVGIIGVGAIGRETAKVCQAFGMNVIGVRHSGKESDYVDEMYTPDQLDAMLPECDYVIVTLPLTKETEGLFGAKQFKQMKNDAYFINIGRGQIVVEKDMITALQEGEIAGAGLDVFEKEPLQEESPLWEMENVIITPHTAGSTEYYDQRVIEDIFIPNLKNYLKGEKLTVNLTDFNKGY